MSKISEEELLHHIEDGIAQLTPNCADEIWERPIAPADGSEWYLDSGAKKVRAGKKRYFISTAAACLALCIISSLFFQLMPSASVYLDVNPSVELKVNYSNRVTAAIPCNADAEEILEDMDFRGTDLDVALYAILGSMVHHGYLTENTNTILVSVYSANTGHAQKLEAEVSGKVSQNLKKMINSGEVLSQQIKQNNIEQIDSYYGSTPGKALFVDGLEDKYPQLKQENLDGLTVDEIVSHLNKEGLDYSEYQKEDEDEDDEDDYDEDDAEDDDD